jgi:hypothetical protein
MLEIKNIILIGIYSKNIERVDNKNERKELLEEMLENYDDSSILSYADEMSRGDFEEFKDEEKKNKYNYQKKLAKYIEWVDVDFESFEESTPLL